MRRTRCLAEKLRANVSRSMDDRADQNAVAVLGVEYNVRLKPKAPETGLEVVGGLSDAGEVREQAECAL